MSGVFQTDQPPVITSPPGEIDCDIAVIGSGMGGGTMAWALRNSGARVLLVERGDRLPAEEQNWSPRAVTAGGTRTPSSGSTSRRGSVPPGQVLLRRRQHEDVRRLTCRGSARTTSAVEHADGVSDAWPLTYAEMERTTARPRSCTRCTAARAGTHGAVPLGGLPVSRRGTRTGHLPARRRHRQAGPAPVPDADGRGLRHGGRCILCATCDGYPCRVDAKSDADVNAVRPALRRRAFELADPHPGPHARHDPGRTGRRRRFRERDGRPVRIVAKRFVLAAGAVNTAALLLRSVSTATRGAWRTASGLVGRNYMAHVTARSSWPSTHGAEHGPGSRRPSASTTGTCRAGQPLPAGQRAEPRQAAGRRW